MNDGESSRVRHRVSTSGEFIHSPNQRILAENVPTVQKSPAKAMEKTENRSNLKLRHCCSISLNCMLDVQNELSSLAADWDPKHNHPRAFCAHQSETPIEPHR
ncbi:predicted protein [Histoplasma capsulatum var. duboisii H88]|uniref:Predicted protein n=1 Tax=Ajellomyces capsulatus (strain H88) TaxID=544711 RepID=F0URG1_AJEC8|nr:predicted protein [Histoplasma capsulatum var. duboisii H88]